MRCSTTTAARRQATTKLIWTSLASSFPISSVEYVVCTTSNPAAAAARSAADNCPSVPDGRHQPTKRRTTSTRVKQLPRVSIWWTDFYGCIMAALIPPTLCPSICQWWWAVRRLIWLVVCLNIANCQPKWNGQKPANEHTTGCAAVVKLSSVSLHNRILNISFVPHRAIAVAPNARIWILARAVEWPPLCGARAWHRGIQQWMIRYGECRVDLNSKVELIYL